MLLLCRSFVCPSLLSRSTLSVPPLSFPLRQHNTHRRPPLCCSFVWFGDREIGRERVTRQRQTCFPLCSGTEHFIHFPSPATTDLIISQSPDAKQSSAVRLRSGTLIKHTLSARLECSLDGVNFSNILCVAEERTSLDGMPQIVEPETHETLTEGWVGSVDAECAHDGTVVVLYCQVGTVTPRRRSFPAGLPPYRVFPPSIPPRSRIRGKLTN